MQTSASAGSEADRAVWMVLLPENDIFRGKKSSVLASLPFVFAFRATALVYLPSLPSEVSRRLSSSISIKIFNWRDRVRSERSLISAPPLRSPFDTGKCRGLCQRCSPRVNVARGDLRAWSLFSSRFLPPAAQKEPRKGQLQNRD